MGSKRRRKDDMRVVISGALDPRQLEMLRLQITRIAREMGAEVTAWRVQDAAR